jgi:hypothetical protein
MIEQVWQGRKRPAGVKTKRWKENARGREHTYMKGGRRETQMQMTLLAHTWAHLIVQSIIKGSWSTKAIPLLR